MMNQQPIATSDMLFTVTCPYASTTYLFLDQEKGTKLIATDLSAPRPTTDGTANFAIAQLYTSDCRQGE